MTGKEILEAMSFVDEAYIEEAETGNLSAGSTLRKLLPLAACLCLLIAAFWPDKREMMVSQQAQVNADLEIVVLEKDSVAETQNLVSIIADSEVPSIVLRIVAWTESGFTAMVERYVDSGELPIGETVQVEFNPNICMEVLEGGYVNAIRRIPTQADFPEGSLVQVRYIAKSGATGVIVAEAISSVPED